ncbi:uncharacterized protein LOC123691178 [Colias croceus]|uniref:uncharacterized protein LOC123691178 n=1 Tax=Colias crocea TaxID=72248 RepID=UPI001E27FD8D|nr:uncharacterized protein LOC123691178 [Colias croceus]
MLRLSNEDWERKKWYLARKYFEEEPRLSPIPESRERRSSTDSNEYLPELNIEVVPKRKDVDDPEETYQELEKKMKEIISADRRGCDAPKSDTIDKESVELNAIEEHSSPEINDLRCLYNSDNCTERPSGASGCVENEELSVIVEQETSKTNKSRIKNSDARYIDQELCEDEIIAAPCSPFRSRAPSIELPKLASTEDASEDKSNGDSVPKPDIMRRKRSILRSTDVSKYISENTSTGYPTSLSHAASELSVNSEVDSQNSILEPLMCSTPKVDISDKGIKRKQTSKISSSAVKKSKTAQTSFSDHDENGFIWNNFFVGKPIVYNLCRCNDHVCS